MRSPQQSRVGSAVRKYVLRSLIAWLLMFASLRPMMAATFERPVPEYSVKAGYLLLFTRYVTWPESKFPTADAPLIVAIVGDDPFGAVLDETMRDQRVGQHPIVIQKLDNTNEAQHAHLVFVAASSRAMERRWFEALSNRAILTVGETPDSLDAGAVVRLVEDRGRIRFDIDRAGAERAGLKISSPMLVSARRLRG